MPFANYRPIAKPKPEFPLDLEQIQSEQIAETIQTIRDGIAALAAGEPVSDETEFAAACQHSALAIKIDNERLAQLVQIQKEIDAEADATHDHGTKMDALNKMIGAADLKIVELRKQLKGAAVEYARLSLERANRREQHGTLKALREANPLLCHPDAAVAARHMAPPMDSREVRSFCNAGGRLGPQGSFNALRR